MHRPSRIRLCLALIAVVVFGFPLLWMLYTGLKTPAELQAHPWRLPSRPTLDNFATVLRDGAFGRYYLNSLIISVLGGLLSLLVGSLAAYGLARLRFRGRAWLLTLFLAGMMIPVHVTLVPLFVMLGKLGWLNTHAALILPYAAFGLPMTVFVLHAFFRRVPRELEEAGRLDGCSTWRLYWSILLPVAKPALATVAIFNFVTMWNEFVFALTLVGESESARTLPLGLWKFSEQFGDNLPAMSAAIAVSVLPALLVYFFAQKHIIRGLTAGALSG